MKAIIYTTLPEDYFHADKDAAFSLKEPASRAYTDLSIYELPEGYTVSGDTLCDPSGKPAELIDVDIRRAGGAPGVKENGKPVAFHKLRDMFWQEIDGKPLSKEIFLSWSFANGIDVYEKYSDENAHRFGVYRGERLLGYVLAAGAKGQAEIREKLDSGEDPISAAWDDGKGNTCTEEGWYIDVDDCLDDDEGTDRMGMDFLL